MGTKRGRRQEKPREAMSSQRSAGRKQGERLLRLTLSLAAFFFWPPSFSSRFFSLQPPSFCGLEEFTRQNASSSRGALNHLRICSASLCTTPFTSAPSFFPHLNVVSEAASYFKRNDQKRFLNLQVHRHNMKVLTLRS